VIITAGRLAGQLCWSEPWTGFSARTGEGHDQQCTESRQTGQPGQPGDLLRETRDSYHGAVDRLDSWLNAQRGWRREALLWLYIAPLAIMLCAITWSWSGLTGWIAAPIALAVLARLAARDRPARKKDQVGMDAPGHLVAQTDGRAPDLGLTDVQRAPDRAGRLTYLAALAPRQRRGRTDRLPRLHHRTHSRVHLHAPPQTGSRRTHPRVLRRRLTADCSNAGHQRESYFRAPQARLPPTRSW